MVNYLPDTAGGTRDIQSEWQIRAVGNGNPVQYSCLENSIDRGNSWQATVHRAAEPDVTSTHKHIHTHIHLLN